MDSYTSVFILADAGAVEVQRGVDQVDRGGQRQDVVQGAEDTRMPPAQPASRGRNCRIRLISGAPPRSTAMMRGALTLDQLDAPGRLLRHVPCRTAGLARQHHRSRTKIRTRCGPNRLSSRRFHPLLQVRGDGERVPPADHEPPGVLLAEEAGLLLDARWKAPELGFHPSGAFRSARSRPSPARPVGGSSGGGC